MLKRILDYLWPNLPPLPEDRIRRAAAHIAAVSSTIDGGDMPVNPDLERLMDSTAGCGELGLAISFLRVALDELDTIGELHRIDAQVLDEVRELERLFADDYFLR